MSQLSNTYQTTALSLEELRAKADAMRVCPTFSEARAQDALEAGGIVFESQVVFGYYVLDFVVPSKLLVVEIDGKTHESSRKHDQNRDAFVAALGLRTVRIPNELANTALARVLEVPDALEAARWPAIKAQALAAREATDSVAAAQQARQTERLARKQRMLDVINQLDPNSTGAQIKAALRAQRPETVLSAGQLAAKERAKQKRLEKGRKNKAKQDAKIAARRAARA